ncbi:trna (guanosine(18)-2'-o)-methyltransferase [Fagus crenata]
MLKCVVKIPAVMTALYSVMMSAKVLEALSPHILDVRKDKFRNVVRNRTYSLCLVVEGLCDLGNVSATFRSADALGFQYRDNRHVSMGAEKWLDIELWNSIHDCFQVLKSRGYRIATMHVGMDAVLLSSFPFPALFPNLNPAFTPSFPFPALCLLRSPFTTWISHIQLQ